MRNRKPKETKTISVLFSTYTDFVSRLVGFMSGFGCTHVSIALDEKDEYFYAFNTKGFRKEYPRKHKNRITKNTCVRLSVSNRQYQKLKKMIAQFESQKDQYKYDYFGIVLCLFRLHRKNREKSYFCSSFVAHVLNKAKIVQLRKANTRYLPYQLQKELLLCPLMIGLAQNIFI